MLRDPYGRPVRSIRVSVTRKCNLRCFYCHREGEEEKALTEMTADEICNIIKIAASFGVNKVKLTGGEPLLRADIIEVVSRIRGLRGIREIAMTTNGVLLEEYALDLRAAGLDRVNISLDTLNPDKYSQITGLNALTKVLSGIKEAKRVGFSPIKLNMVILRGVNDDEVERMITFAEENALTLQIIELESKDEDEIYREYHVELDKIEEYFLKRAEKVTVRRMHHRKKYRLSSGGEVEVVKPMHNTEFCSHCNRLRVTSDGKLKPCLFRNDNLVDIVGPMRKGASEEALRKIFIEAVKLREPYFK